MRVAFPSQHYGNSLQLVPTQFPATFLVHNRQAASALAKNRIDRELRAGNRGELPFLCGERIDLHASRPPGNESRHVCFGHIAVRTASHRFLLGLLSLRRQIHHSLFSGFFALLLLSKPAEVRPFEAFPAGLDTYALRIAAKRIDSIHVVWLPKVPNPCGNGCLVAGAEPKLSLERHAIARERRIGFVVVHVADAANEHPSHSVVGPNASTLR